MSEALTRLGIVGRNRDVGHSGTVLETVRIVREGLPITAIDYVLESNRLSVAELDRLVLPRKTLANRRKLGSLTAEQSDRLVRVARLLAMAEATFGARETAAVWLRRPTSALAGDRPIDLLDTDEGARLVENLLGRIDHGIAA